MKRAIIAALLCVALPAQASAESWLCIADMATGFKLDKTTKKWREASFNVADERYVIRSVEGKAWKYDVQKFGDSGDFSLHTCAVGANDLDLMFCEGMFGEFRFNVRSLRYLMTNPIGYVEIGPKATIVREGENDPAIQIGRCSKI